MSFRINKTSQTYQLKTLKKKLTGAIIQSGQPLVPPEDMNPFYDLCIGNSIIFYFVPSGGIFSEGVYVEGGISIKEQGGPTIASNKNLTNPEYGGWYTSNVLLNRYVNDAKYDITNQKWFATGLGDDNKSLICSANRPQPTTWQNIENPPFDIGECILPTFPILFGGVEKNGNTISYSQDGMTFSYPNNNPFLGGKCNTINTKFYYKYDYDPDFRMAGGYDQDRTVTIASSSDQGLNWDILSNPLDGGECRSLVYNTFLEIWIAVGYNEDRTVSIIYSKDGILFEEANSPFIEVYSVTIPYYESETQTMICCGKDIMNNDRIAYTNDGIEWILITNPLPLSIIKKVGYGAPSSIYTFLAVGYGNNGDTSQTTMMGSQNGIEWIPFNTNNIDTPSSLLQVLEQPLVKSYINDQNTTTLYDSNTAVDRLRLWMGLDT